MLHIRTILHPTDFSPCAQAAFAHALHLARRYGAALHMLHVAPALDLSHLRDVIGAVLDEDAFFARQQRDIDAQKQALLDAYETEDVRLRGIVRHGVRPASLIREYAEAEDIDLVVLGTHGERGIQHLLLGSVAEELVRRLSCPVLTVRAPGEAPDVAVLTPRRLLVPVDFSVYAYDALRYARALAAHDQAHLDLLHVVDPVRQPGFYEECLQGRAAVQQVLETDARHELAAFYQHVAGPAVDVAFHAVTGYPPHEIAAFAERAQSDLLVIATHGLRGLERIPMGSVTERVVRQAPCPVFITRPFGKSLLRTRVAFKPGTAPLPTSP